MQDRCRSTSRQTRPVFETLEARLLLAAVHADEAWLAGVSFLGVDAGATASVQPVCDDDGATLAWIVTHEPEGFVIVAGDTDVAPVLGYADTGSFPFDDTTQNVLLDLVRSDVRDRLTFTDTSTIEANHAEWRALLSAEPERLLKEGPLGATEWGPLITFATFNQGAPYNIYCPLDPTGARSYTGCAPTAVTQLLSYWEYPFGMTFTSADRYASWGENGTIWIDSDAALRDFPTFAELSTALSSIAYDFSPDEIAYLMFATGVVLNADYSSVSTSAGVSPSDLTGGFGFVSAQRNAGWNDAVRDELIENIQAGRPAYLALSRDEGGHSVLADGYRDTGEFHLNLGWGGAADAWYFLPDVDTGYGYHYTAVNYVLTDIAPLVVTSPVGGETWSRGSDVQITWRSSASVAPVVDIELWQAGVYQSTIVSATANNGTYTWAIPATQAPGSDYTVRVVSSTNPAHFGQTDAVFTITRYALAPADYVNAVYEGFLRRAPVAAEETWAGAALAGGVSRAELAAYFATVQPEFEAYVAPILRLYRAYLGRCPDPDGLTSWVSAVRSGVPLSAITVAFASSPEFVSLHGDVYWQASNTDFVTWLYNTVLGRAPDAGGLDAWRTALEVGAITRDGMMVQFSQSVEYVAAHANETTVTALYMGLLARGAADVEIAGWCTALAGGSTPTAVAHAFLQSAEYERACVKTVMSWSAPVERLYLSLLGRSSDYAGLMGWTNGVRAGALTLAEVARGFVTSPEITGVYGDVYYGYSNAQYVTWLYNRVLGRDPSPAEVAMWQPALDDGWMTREQMVLGFTESAEYVANTLTEVNVALAFATLFRRVPTPAERVQWENYLATHTLDEMLDQLFIA